MECVRRVCVGAILDGMESTVPWTFALMTALEMESVVLLNLNMTFLKPMRKKAGPCGLANVIMDGQEKTAQYQWRETALIKLTMIKVCNHKIKIISMY